MDHLVVAEGFLGASRIAQEAWERCRATSPKAPGFTALLRRSNEAQVKALELGDRLALVLGLDTRTPHRELVALAEGMIERA